MNKRPFTVTTEAIRSRLIDAIMALPLGFACIIQDITRTLEQNAKLHAVLGDLSKQLLFMGKKRTLLQWKILIISGHATATEADDVEVLPGLEGEFVTFRESSATMSKKRLASVIEYIYAYGSQNGVVWGNAAREVIDEMGVNDEAQ